MPRLGARPTACRACRARRKACDGRRPGCGQCERRHVICPGYSKELDVVFVQPGEQDDLKSDVSSSDSDLVILQSDLSRKVLVRPSSSSTKRKPLLEVDPNPQILPFFSLAKTYQTQALDLYLDTYLPRSRSQGGKDLPSTLAWLPAAMKMSFNDPLLNNALLALSLAHLGDGGLHDQQQTRSLYGSAVKALSARIQRQDGALNDSTLAAILAMGWYEGQLANMSGSHGWVSHVEGANALIQIRGSQNFSSQFGENLFLACQLTSFIAQLARREAFPISTTWPKKESSSYLRLFRILRLVPAIFQQGDITRTTSRDTPEEERTKRVSMLAYLCQDFHSRISIWHDQLLQYEAISTTEPFWLTPSDLYATLPKDDPARVFPTCYDFTNIDVAQQLVLYWTGSLMVDVQIVIADQWFSGHELPSAEFYPPDLNFQKLGMRTYLTARHLVRSMEYFIHPDRGKVAQDFLGCPINLAIGYFCQRPGPETHYLKAIVRRMNERRIGLGKLVTGMAAQGGGRQGFEFLWNS